MPRSGPAELPPHLLLTLDEALARLPNIKPRTARQQLQRAYDRLLWKRRPRSAGGLGRGPAGARVELAPRAVLSFKEVGDLFVRDSDTEAPRVTPEGAAVLVRLYEAGAFEPAKPRLGRGDPAELRAYAESRDALAERAEAALTEERERARQHDHWVAHPEQFPEAEFAFELLSQVFWTHAGTSPDPAIRVGGVLVRKEIGRPASDPGDAAATSDVEIRFTWTGSDGERRSLGRRNRAGPSDPRH